MFYSFMAAILIGLIIQGLSTTKIPIEWYSIPITILAFCLFELSRIIHNSKT